MDLELKGKTGLVLAGSQGLGRAIAETWAAEGVAVAIVARSREALDAVVAGIRERGGSAFGLVADLGDWSALEAAAAEARAKLGPIDMLLLNTGGPSPTGPTGVSPAVWEEHFQTMLMPLVRVTEMLLPDMRARGFGRLLYIAAPGILTPMTFTTVSQSMRVAVASWLKTVAAEVAAEGVTVNTIIPGIIETDRVFSLAKKRSEIDGVPPEQHLSNMLADVPMGRMGTPREFAAVATFLASPLGGYVTGSILKVDGGLIRAL
jgi:3-oxoacyl-[acyl-carrier protein] reductase